MTRPDYTTCLTKAEDTLCDMLAESAAAQAFLNATDKSTALGRIFVDALPEPASREVYTSGEWELIQRSHLIVGTEPESGFVYNLVATETMDSSGVLWFQAKRLTTTAEDADKEYMGRMFKNSVGDIMECLAQNDCGLEIMRMVFSGPMIPEDTATEHDSHWIAAEVTVEWGLGGGGE